LLFIPSFSNWDINLSRKKLTEIIFICILFEYITSLEYVLHWNINPHFHLDSQEMNKNSQTDGCHQDRKILLTGKNESISKKQITGFFAQHF